MSRARSLAVSCLLAVASAAPAVAQVVSDDSREPLVIDVISPQQDRELGDWLDRMDAWRRFQTKHENRPARDAFGRLVARPQVPDPPEWLPGYCASVAALGIADLTERTGRGCRLLADPRAIEGAPPPPSAEEPERYGTFLTRLHLDGLWVTTSSGPRAYGLIGSHLTLVDVGRVQIFGPPGVLLLSVPDGAGGRRTTLGYTWGLSVRLTDVRMLSRTKNMTLFLTMSKVWVGGSDPEQIGARSFQIAGLSLAPRKK